MFLAQVFLKFGNVFPKLFMSFIDYSRQGDWLLKFWVHINFQNPALVLALTIFCGYLSHLYVHMSAAPLPQRLD
jgi:hypothetical protein